MSRRVRLLVFLGFMMVTVFSMGLPAGAAPEDVQVKRVEVGDAQQRLEEIQTEASVSYEAYDSALLGLNDLDDQIAGTERKLSEAEERLAEAQASLEESATQVYKSGNVGFIDVLVGSDDFSEFAARMELWVRLLAQERERFNAVLDAKNEIEAERAALEARREKRAAALEEAMQEKEQAENAEAEMQSYLDSLSGELQAAIEEEQALQAKAAREAALAAAQAAQAAEEEAEPIETVQVAQVAPRVSQADLQAEREAAEQRAAERAEKRAAAEAAAEEAERQAELAAQEAAAERAEKREAAEQAAAERRAEAEEARRAAEQAAIEEAAAQRAAELAAQQEAAKQAAEQAAAEQAAAEQAAAEQAAAEQAAEQAAAEQQQTPPAPQTPAPSPAPGGGSTPPASGGGSCGDTFGGSQPYVAEVGCLVRAQFGIQTIYGVRAGDPGDHGTGRALDIMTYSDVNLAYQVADFLLANQGQYNISYVITQQQINFGSGWQPMEDRGDPTQNHMDHVHVSFY